jgi:hypothetical protein
MGSSLPIVCKKKFGIAQTKNRLRAMQYSVESFFIIEYLYEYEFIFEMALAHESGGPGVLIDEKTEGRKSRDTVPLRDFSPKNANIRNF